MYTESKSISNEQLTKTNAKELIKVAKQELKPELAEQLKKLLNKHGIRAF